MDNNYWVFQANPETYFILQYWLVDYAWKRPPGYIDWWGVEKEFDGQFNPGDIAFLWKCIGEPPDAKSEYYKWQAKAGWQNKGRGIYAVARVTDYARWGKLHAAELVGQEKYYVNLEKAMEYQLRVRFEYPEEAEWKRTRANLLVDPVLWHDDRRRNRQGVESLKGLKDLQRNFGESRNAQGIKAFRLKLEEGIVLWERVFRGALPPPF